MMRRIGVILLGSLLLLSLSACGQPGQQTASPPAGGADASDSAAQSLPSSSAEGWAGREEHGSIEMTVEGTKETVSATLYLGDGYSIYIPDEGWRLDEPGEWEDEKTGDATLKILFYSGQTFEQARAQILLDEDGYGFMDLGTDGYFCGQDGEDATTMEVQLKSAPDGTFAILSEYPDEAVEGFGARLSAMAETFLTDTEALAE